MFKITVTNKSGDILSIVETNAPDAFITDNIDKNSWGKPERWVSDQERYDINDVIDSRESVYVEDGQLKSNREVLLRSEYVIDTIDITYDYELDLCLQQRIAEYPGLGEFLNAYFDGGQSALDALKANRLAVKQKYPKPVKPDV